MTPVWYLDQALGHRKTDIIGFTFMTFNIIESLMMLKSIKMTFSMHEIVYMLDCTCTSFS